MTGKRWILWENNAGENESSDSCDRNPYRRQIAQEEDLVLPEEAVREVLEGLPEPQKYKVPGIATVKATLNSNPNGCNTFSPNG